MAHTADTQAHSRISDMAVDLQIVLEDCRTIDAHKLRDQVEWLEIAAQMHQLADRLERIARREMARDTERENVNHDKALNLARNIAAINERRLSLVADNTEPKIA